MAKKRRPSSDKPRDAAPLTPAAASAAAVLPSASVLPGRADPEPLRRPAPAPAVAAVGKAPALPGEVVRSDWTMLIFALMMFLAPAVGVPHEEMLQDTLKSAVVSFAALGALLLFFWQQRNRREGLRWHGVMWLFIAMCLYALVGTVWSFFVGIDVWSHYYLSGVEAIRWFILAVVLWLTINTATRERVNGLAWGIHWGAVVASLWTALQFWVDFKYFPQGPNPASTFVNRNFFAEFVVCTMPFSVLLLANARKSPTIFVLALTLAFNTVALWMTGTRAAMAAFYLIVPIMVFILWLYRARLAFSGWSRPHAALAIGVLAAGLAGLGSIPTANEKLIHEHKIEQRGMTPIGRAVARTASALRQEEFTQKSFSVRLIMWRATATIIQKRPLTGVGAGAWEAYIPLYQAEGSQLETDYYVHNEILQLLAEYGLLGWLVLLGLLGYLSLAAWRTVRAEGDEGRAEAPMRALTLTMLLAFLVVSNAGFPWRLASTGALFALGLGILAASDARLGLNAKLLARRIAWQPAYSQIGAIITMLCLALAAYITQKAAECESKIVKSTKFALTISAAGDVHSPRWDKTKNEMLRLIKEGTDINPHYRKITPMVADELAKWGDWKNAIWVWESVLSSRPYVVAILSNVARGYASTGQPEKAMEYLDRAKRIQPKASAVRSLEVILLSRMGREKDALNLAKTSIAEGVYDFDLTNAGLVLGWRNGDFAFAEQAALLRIKGWPDSAGATRVQLANMYLTGLNDEARALKTFREALEGVPPEARPGLVPQIPQHLWGKLGIEVVQQPAPANGAQTSSTKR